MPLEIDTTVKADEVTAKLNGILDISTVELFQAKLAIHKTVSKVSLDFGEVHFVDSTGLGSLARVLRDFRRDAVQVIVKNIAPEVFEVFDILGLPEVFGNETFQIKI